jgi:Amt family ammonium transporter
MFEHYIFSFVTFAIVSILWFVYGYNLAFGTDIWGFLVN